MLYFHAYFCIQVKKFLEHVNHQLPNVSKNLFILFNHWDRVEDEDEDSDNDEDSDGAVHRQNPKVLHDKYLQKVHEFLVQGLQSKAVMDRTFFVSGKEACKVQENEKNGKQASSGELAGVYSTNSNTIELLFIYLC